MRESGLPWSKRERLKKEYRSWKTEVNTAEITVIVNFLWNFRLNGKYDNIISTIVGIRGNCDQNGNRVSKNDKSCCICSMNLKTVFS